ncbi:hypothetical protein ACINK0_19005 (plasmid) [Deinococcus sp. VB343]|uniref:hypothetical protein n=1 Tax=Deinococcus sp. VB343 TaxID=3385567 RepID=UPI0039C8FEB8
MTGNQGFGRLAQLRDEQQQEPQAQTKQTKRPAPALPDLELPDLPAPAATQQEVTRLLSAQVPQALKLAFDKRVLEARAYFPDLEMKEGVAALLELLEDERVYRMWLHKIGERKD